MNYATVTDYYSGSGPYDAAFAAAFNASPTVRVPAGTYSTSGPITLSGGRSLLGDSYADTKIICQAANQPVVVINNGSDGVVVRDITLSHEGIAVTDGGDGIAMPSGSTCDNVLLTDVYCQYSRVGMNLQQVGRGVIRNCLSRSNSLEGFRMTGTGSNALQWQFEASGASLNGSDGFHWITTGSAPATSTGTVNNCTTFGNGGRGLAVEASPSNPLAALRIEGGFFGGDHSHGIYLDTYSTHHVLRPTFIEQAGDCGIYLTNNNSAVHVAPGFIVQAAQDGLFIYCPDVDVVGGVYLGNGLAHNNGRQNGIYCFGVGSATVTGVRSLDGGGNSQAFGLVSNGNVLAVGNNFRGNLQGSITGNIAPESTGNQT